MTLSSSHRTQIAERTDERIKLPQPDLKNITVLSDNLPDTPILPWNHYDSRLDAEVQAMNGHRPEPAGHRQQSTASDEAVDAGANPEVMEDSASNLNNSDLDNLI